MRGVEDLLSALGPLTVDEMKCLGLTEGRIRRDLERLGEAGRVQNVKGRWRIRRKPKQI
jgi:DeoR/GlpR family transcriptional regulator of sugar metabolism